MSQTKTLPVDWLIASGPTAVNGPVETLPGPFEPEPSNEAMKLCV